MPLKQFAKLSQGSGVHHVLCTEPTFAGKGYAEIEKAEVGCLVGVWVDAAEDSKVASLVPPAPVEVKAPGVGIEFNPSPSGGCSIEDFMDIHRIGFALEQEASSRVA
jgi:hypothetical protein